MESERSSKRLAIHFENVFDNETFVNSLILVRGVVNVVVVHANESSVLCVHRLNRGASSLETETRLKSGGTFCTVLHLDVGENEFQFCINEHTLCRRTLFYRPAKTDYVVMPLYVRCNASSEKTAAEGDGDRAGVTTSIRNECYEYLTDDIADKIKLGCRLIQMIMAETLRRNGFFLRTFALEENTVDWNGNNCIAVFDSALRCDTVRKTTPEKLWERLSREIMTSKFGRKNRKFLAFLSSGTGEEPSRLVAIGGGGLALCDAEYLRTWPATLQDFNADFAWDNSARSSPKESAYSTSLGAVCHELCHAFDLGHTVHGIMGRDFHRISTLFGSISAMTTISMLSSKPENFNSVHGNHNDSLIICEEGMVRRQLDINFRVTDAINGNGSFYDEIVVSDRENIIWDRCVESFDKTSRSPEFWFGGCATLLAYHRWINNCRYNVSSQNEESVCPLRYDNTRCIVTSVYGIVVVQLRNWDGYILKYWEFCHERKKKLFLLPICYVRRSSSVVIEDVAGNLLKHNIGHTV